MIIRAHYHILVPGTICTSLTEWKVILGPLSYPQVDGGHLFFRSLISQSDSQGGGPTLSLPKLMMKGQSGQQLTPLGGSHAVSLTSSGLTSQVSELPGLF